MKRPLQFAVPVGIGLSLALVAGAGLLSLRNLAEESESSAWVSHIHVVIERLETLRAEVLNAESTRRGYVLTGDPRFLPQSLSARDEIQKTLGALRALTADKAVQQKWLDALEPLIQARLDLLRRTPARFSPARPMQTQEVSGTIAGAELTAQILAALDAMAGAEQDLLLERKTQAEGSGRRSRLLLTVGMATTIVLILAAFLLLRREVRERTRAEADVSRFFDVSADLLCVAGADLCFKRMNFLWEKLLGFPVSDLLAKPCLEFIHPEDRARARETLERAARERIEGFECRFRTSGSGYRWLNWNASPDSERRLIYAAARDVTETKEARESLERLNAELEARARQLEETNRELEAFTSSVAHDLRAPLRHVDGFTRILMEEHASQLGPQGQELAARVRRSAQLMGKLVDDLLNLSRLSRREVSPLVTDLNPLVGEVIASLQPACQGRRVEFRVGALPFAECDAGLIRQVFANLLANAVKFTRPRDPAVIEVGQTEHDGARAIFVRDNGVGFSMKYADKLFGVFQRLHRAEDFEGTGVGLVTVQRIIQKHNGRVWAEAEVDRGAAFYFTLEGIEERRAAESPRPQGELHACN